MVSYEVRKNQVAPSDNKSWGNFKPEEIMKAATVWGSAQCNKGFKFWADHWCHSLYPDNTLYHTITGDMSGIENYKKNQQKLHEGFPDYQIIVEDQIAKGDKLAVRYKIVGTNTGSFFGLPPTGKKATLRLQELDHFVNGVLQEGWGVADSLGLMQQLGVITKMGAKK
jgi:predicted ester cyclase